MTFCGGWSYTQKEMDELFKHTWSNMNVLEFGAGDSTRKIFNLLKPSSYYVYETDLSYVPDMKDITTVVYNQGNIENIEINHGVVFDLVLIDGPNGEKRKHWFSKLRSCVKPGTIILVDDFNHYESFGEELDKHFDYELLSFSNEPFQPYGEHSWKIVRIKKQTTTAVVYGTRPEFLKLKPLIDRIKPVVIRINQHENFTEDEGYPHHVVHVNKKSHRLSDIGSAVLEQLPQYIMHCTHVIAQGDTASCFYSLLCAYQMKKVCVHLEAGMRTYDNENPWPEESYRQMISRIASIHLCPSIHESHNLGAENTSGKIYIVGNTILDLVKSYDIPITRDKHVLVTLHRRENWDQYTSLIQRLDTLAQQHTDYDFIFLLHANPELKSIVREHGKNLKITEPLSHRELIKVLSSCTCVITDSGGIQEEANFLGKHIYVLRECTERKSIHPSRCVINPTNIDIDVPSYEQGFEYGDGNAVEKILEYVTL
jgi:UDP-N-acetylglucosamine 2-epimerase (non-hydrolysing)